jgi:N-acetylglucosamine-6-sulfatase
MRLRLGLLTLALLATPAQSQPMPPPNFLFILLDDAALDQFPTMPKLANLLPSARKFSSFYNSLPVCGPSRASFLTGMYPHNSGVVTNDSYNQFNAAGNVQRTWAKSLQDAGYYTAMIGKYLNGYPVGSTEIPEGWDRWWVPYDQRYYNNYDVNDQGVVRHYGEGDNNYVTYISTGKAAEVIDTQTALGRPFAIQVSLACPHTPATPENQYKGSSAGLATPYSSKPNFNPATMPGKPSFIQAMPRLNSTQIARLSRSWHNGVECLRSVDDLITRLWIKLHQAGVLNNTYIILTSDNGYERGEHRLATKGHAYFDSIRSPLYIWGPTVVPGTIPRGIVGNTDIMPTMLDLAGLPIPSWVDGRSLAPLLASDSLTNWRRGYLVRGIDNLTLSDNWTSSPANRFFTYLTTLYQYNLYLTSPRERDLYAWQDVYQMTNIAPVQTAGFIADLDQRLQQLSTCAGASCRAAEDVMPLGAETSRRRR